jgi:hypothetical protein
MRNAWLAVLVLCASQVGCGDPPPAWDKELPTTGEVLPARRGLRAVRGPIHIHSTYSHDACDGMPQIGGMPNFECLARLRSALCRTHQDYAMLTDHAELVESTDWPRLFLPEAGDEPVLEGGEQIASFMACPDGHRVLVQVGSENQIMPLGLRGHVAATPAERGAILRGEGASSAAAFRARGAIVAMAHGEHHPLEQMREVEVQATEIYNLHANLAPDIRSELGLDPTRPIEALLPFLTGEVRDAEPDAIFLLVWEPNPVEVGRLEALWSEGRHVTATLGVDSHENVISGIMSDGERGDSHRRLLRWFSNHLLVDQVTPAAIMGAITSGRGYGVFEIFGVPLGFDFRAEGGGGTQEMGETIAVGDELVLEAPRSDFVGRDDLRLRILRVAGGSSVEVASSVGDAPLRYKVEAAAVYRAEVLVRPRRFAHLFGNLPIDLEPERVWVYTNPFYAR